MNDLPQLIKHSWRTGVSCTLVLVAVIGAGTGLAILQKKLQGTLDSATQERNRQATALSTLADNLRAARDGRADFEQQQRDGLVGPAQREEWVQSLITAYQARHFSGTPDYKLLAPTPFSGPTGGGAATVPGAAPAAAGGAAVPGAAGMDAGAAAAGGVATTVHEMRFQLANAHELDVLNILERLSVEHGAVMRVKGCALSDPAPDGMKAACTVQFLNVARQDAPTGGSAAVAAAPGTP